MTKRFPYLLNRNGHYYFRISIPKPLQVNFGKKQIWLSLNTNDPNEGKRRSLHALSITEAFLDNPHTLIPSKLYEHLRTELAPTGYHLPRKRPLVSSPSTIIPCASLGTQEGVALSTLFESYLAECTADKPRTVEQKIAVQKLWLEAMGDFPVSKLSKVQAREFKAILMKLPSNWRKRFKGFKVHDVLAQVIPEKHRLSVSSINLMMSHMNSFTNWMIKNGHYSDSNPFLGMALKQNELAKEKRNPFTSEQLQKIFTSPVFSGCLSDKPQDRFKAGHLVMKDGFYWVTLIALFSGARMQEICQLYTEDILLIDGIWVFDLNDDGSDKELKTSSSKRRIPVHPFLIRLGLLEHHALQKSLGYQRLFPDLPKSSNGTYSGIFSKRFSYFLKRIGAKSDKTSFHSFRHTFIDAMRNTEVPRELREALVGHSSLQSAHDNYGSAIGIRRLYSGLLQLPYGQIKDEALDGLDSLSRLFK